MYFWKKWTPAAQKAYIDAVLQQNIDFQSRTSLGIPASKLDGKVFFDQASFLQDAPYLSTAIQNPNHIGCHTLENSELFFSGTQQIERELIQMVAVDILQAEVDQVDGYVATGGTEANIQAVWMYRNYFMKEYGARLDEIIIVASEDTHYSVAKASNLLCIDVLYLPVNPENREVRWALAKELLQDSKNKGKQYVIVLSNVATTMFGSTDDPNAYAELLTTMNMPFKIHLDAAFGGLIYPILQPNNQVNFQNPNVSSVTLDAHKMLQAPYGTGMFIARKNLMHYVITEEASYVHGMDITLCGSRSGANAIAIWMILTAYGPHGWFEKMKILQHRTDWACAKLQSMNIRFYRHPAMNIITMNADQIPEEIAQKYGLVPDTHTELPKYYKIVVMEHVEIEALEAFIYDLQQQRVISFV